MRREKKKERKEERKKERKKESKRVRKKERKDQGDDLGVGHSLIYGKDIVFFWETPEKEWKERKG